MTNNEITQGALVRIDHNAPGSLSAVRLISRYIECYGDSVGIVLEDNDHHVVVLFSNGDKKYIHKLFLELLE